MEKMFKEFCKNEKNEMTALALMLGVLSEKLTEIAVLIEKSNKLSSEIFSCLNNGKMATTKEIIIIEPMTSEDYMD